MSLLTMENSYTQQNWKNKVQYIRHKQKKSWKSEKSILLDREQKETCQSLPARVKAA